MSKPRSRPVGDIGPRKRASSQSRKKENWIALLIDTSSTWGRQIITGAVNFSKCYTSWKIMVETRGIEEHLRIPKGLRCDGVIARISSEKMADTLQALAIPVVNVSGINLAHSAVPRVTSDTRKVVEMGSKHLIEKGFANFAYFSLHGLSYVRIQQNNFQSQIEEMGYRCALLGVPSRSGAEPDWSTDIGRLVERLRALPKPVAIFTWNASSAREIIYACMAGGILVPDEVAVLSGSEDDLLCEASPIPISAVQPACQMIGFRAAELLNDLMHGRAAPCEPILIPPLNVITRQSTDNFTLRDEALARVLNYLREGALKNLGVDDLARKAGLSRRVLERRFREVLRRTPAEEIRRARLDCARKLLVETDLPISSVSEASGFPNKCYFASLFGGHFGMTPAQYRHHSRPQ